MGQWMVIQKLCWQSMNTGGDGWGHTRNMERHERVFSSHTPGDALSILAALCQHALNEVPCAPGPELVSSGGGRVDNLKSYKDARENIRRVNSLFRELCTRMN